MKLITLLNFYKYTIDWIDVYEDKTENFLYGGTPKTTILKDMYVKHFNIFFYEEEEKTVLEIFI